MNIFIYIGYKIAIYFYRLRVFFNQGRINALKDENERIKKALGKHDFPTSQRSTKYPDENL